MKTSRYNALKQTEEGRERIKADNRRKWEQRKARQRLADGPEQLQLRRPAPVPRDPVQILAIDGEGIQHCDGSHRYVLLASSMPSRIYNAHGLSTEECLSWILQHGGPNRRVVSYAMTYDANMILRDLPAARRDELSEWNECYWQGKRARWHIMWYPGHTLTISRTQTDIDGAQLHTVTADTVTVWDVFGWFQTTLQTALQEWQIGTPQQRARLAAAQQTLSGTLARNLELKCELLAQLVGRAEQSLVELGIHVKRRDGAGAIAGALLESHDVRRHMREEPPSDTELAAYYGGRSQALAIGRFRDVHHYDINSAYPSVMPMLPSLRGHWRVAKQYEADANYAIWFVRWAVGGQRSNPHWPLTPFPWRDGAGAISYPAAGCGWYWTPEIDVARWAWGKRISVEHGYVWEPDDPTLRPLAWVSDWYEERKARRAAGDPSHRLIKLGLNAMYGKMSQGVGYRGKKPPWQSFTWAGIITSCIRARLLKYALTNPRAVIAFGTDGIWTQQKLDIMPFHGLGEWSHDTADELFLLAPTVYASRRQGEEWQIHAAGYRQGEFPLQELLAGWGQSRYYHTERVDLKRFLGLQLARQLERSEDWGRWIDVPTEIACCPGSGTPAAAFSNQNHEWCYWEQPNRSRRELPAPYEPKTSRLELGREGGAALAMLLDQPEPLL